ncbi:SulP family inorganic anion transporter [Pseudodesulfovibrio sediminis]|uniref:Sulfate permease n=1 Tax=Pseudodesulfovibrio sediminis TaxID=2810563 RepID=A0ABN6EMX5_9BACT|nr:SulP family inorganic anion transporter [Pseudodesulfovibrio sediminis]BCS87447.1 sulfate permease [Pseudodesulfovibrio sediminis]
MAIFKCGSCEYERDVPDKLLGKRAKCPDCGHGVTIIAAIEEEEPLFDVDFEEDEIAEEGVPLSESSGEGEPIQSIDLDHEDVTVAFTGPEDILCSECGHVLEPGTVGECPNCGAPISSVDTLPEVDESEIDVSDLAGESVPQVWDAEFDGAEESEVIEEEDPDTWRLFKGSVSLNVYAGIVSGVLGLFFVYSLSLLTSSQAGTAELLPYILGMALVGVVVGSIAFSFQSRIPFAQVAPETVLTAVLFLLVGSIHRSMVEEYTFEYILPTVLAAIVLSALFVGLCLLLLGKFKVGEYVRYIPLQIIGGVIGGVGVFVLFGAFDWIDQIGLDWSNSYTLMASFVGHFTDKSSILAIGPSLVFGLVLFVAMWRVRNSLYMLAIILVASCAGYAAGIWGGSDALRALAAPVPFVDGSAMVHPFAVFSTGWVSLDNIQWGVIKSNGLYMGALAALTVLTVMFRTTRLEIVRGRETDLNVEYRALGLTNIFSGVCGGMPVALSHGRSLGSYASGGRGPLAGIITGVVCGTGLFYADAVLPLIPRFVPEGLLIYAGLDIIRSWIFRTNTAFTRRSEIWMLRMTFLVTLGFGLLEGVGFGVALALMVSVARASHGGAVRNVLSGANHTSNVDRASAQKRTLKEFGDHIHILRLQGFLFLGSMEHLLKIVRVRLDDKNQLPVEYLVLDFKLVTGIASAAAIGFEKLRNLVAEYGFDLVITSAPLELEDHLSEIGEVGEGDGIFKVFFNLDYALEWCENRVLDAEGMLEMKKQTLPELLAPVFPEPKYIPALMKVLKREVVDTGEAVFRQGDDSNSMFFVESGRLDVELEVEGGKILRLKKVGPGAVFGEMGIYTLASRSATVRAAEKCVLYRMTLDKLDAIEARAPVLVTAINRLLINLLSERLNDANARVRDLML